MTICPRCNAEILDSVSNCHNCGTPLQSMENKFLKQIDINNNQNMKIISTLGKYAVYEHQQELSCYTHHIGAYFAREMNIKKRQVLVTVNNDAIKVQAGAMQWTFGDVECETGLGSGIKAVGNLIKGAVASVVTSETIVKPLYKGTGLVMFEPTFKNIILEDVASWGEEGVVLDDGLFLACDTQLTEKVVDKSWSATLGGNKGAYNLCLSGQGIAVLESPIPI